MKLVRLAALALLAIAAVSIAMASTASAAPEFKTANGSDDTLILTLYGLTLVIFPGVNLDLHCLKSLEHALILNSLLIAHIFDHFLNCVTVNLTTGAACTVKSTNVTEEGVILTNTLHAILGLILPSRAIGLLFLPISGSTWFTLAESAKCEAPETKVTGSIAAEITPTGKLQTTSKTVFSVTSSKQAISDIDVDGIGLVKPKLTGFSVEGALSREGSTTAAEAFEVT